MENDAAAISNNYGAMKNLQRCFSQEMLADDSPKGAKVTKSTNRDRAIKLPACRHSWEVDLY